MKLRLVGPEFFHADGRTNRHDENIVAFRKFATVPKVLRVKLFTTRYNGQRTPGQYGHFFLTFPSEFMTCVLTAVYRDSGYKTSLSRQTSHYQLLSPQQMNTAERLLLKHIPPIVFAVFGVAGIVNTHTVHQKEIRSNSTASCYSFHGQICLSHCKRILTRHWVNQRHVNANHAVKLLSVHVDTVLR
jgi:hypothetical protein